MGIKDLRPYLRKKAKESIKTCKLSDISNSRIAIDMNTYLYAYLRCSGVESMYEGIVHIVHLFQHELSECDTIFVLDGPNKPKLKSIEAKKRQDAKESTRSTLDALVDIRLKLVEISQRIEELEKEEHRDMTPDQIIDNIMGNIHLEDSKVPEEFLNPQDLLLKLKRKWTILVGTVKMMVPDKIIKTTNWTKMQDILRTIDQEIQKCEHRTLGLSGDVLKNAIQILKALGVRYVVAPGEGEEYCCALFRKGLVDIIISRDIDVLAYSGVERLHDLDLAKRNINIFEKDKIRSLLGFESTSTLLDFFIMCGVDYNNRISRVGPAGAHRLMTKYGSIDKLIESQEGEKSLLNKDLGCLNHGQCRDIFLNTSDDENVCIPDLTTPDPEFLKSFKLGSCMHKVNRITSRCDYIPEEIIVYDPSDEHLPIRIRKKS